MIPKEYGKVGNVVLIKGSPSIPDGIYTIVKVRPGQSEEKESKYACSYYVDVRHIRCINSNEYATYNNCLYINKPMIGGELL